MVHIQNTNAIITQSGECKLQKVDTITTQLPCMSKHQKDDLNFSAFLTHTNNMLTAFSVIIAILAVIGAIAGFFSLITIKKLQSNLKTIKKNNKYFKKQLVYFSKSSDCLFNALSDFIANPKTEDLTPRLLFKIQESKLFSINEQERLSALLYFSQNGTKENLDTLRFLAKNDDSKKVKSKSNEVIGIIKQKYEN